MNKATHVLALSSMLLCLAGCSTLATPPQALQQSLPSADQQQLNQELNTAQDNQPELWHSADGDTTYQLTTSNTRLNAQGAPCRDYTLLVDRKYHRKQATTATICRVNGQWQVSN